MTFLANEYLIANVRRPARALFFPLAYFLPIFKMTVLSTRMSNGGTARTRNEPYSK